MVTNEKQKSNPRLQNLENMINSIASNNESKTTNYSKLPYLKMKNDHDLKALGKTPYNEYFKERIN